MGIECENENMERVVKTIWWVECKWSIDFSEVTDYAKRDDVECWLTQSITAIRSCSTNINSSETHFITVFGWRLAPNWVSLSSTLHRARHPGWILNVNVAQFDV